MVGVPALLVGLALVFFSSTVRKVPGGARGCNSRHHTTLFRAQAEECILKTSRTKTNAKFVFFFRAVRPMPMETRS